MKRIFITLNIIILSIVLISCKKGEVDLALYIKDNNIELSIGEKYQIFNEEEAINVTFNSTNEDSVIVYENGLIEAIKEGEAKIIIKSKKHKNIEEEVKVTVLKDLFIDGTETLTAKDLYNNIDLEESFNIELKNNKLIVTDKDSPGEYVSKPIELEKFEQLVLTYNSNKFNKGSILLSVSVGDGNLFSDYYFMATRLNDSNRSTRNQNDDFASVSIDTLNNKDINNNFIKFRIVIREDDPIELKNVSVTTKKANKEFIYNENSLIEKVIDVPPLSQLDVPGIGNVICSPTSVSMVLNYYNKDVTHVDTAKEVLDVTYNIYGNWTFNASYAGTFDNLNARVEYIHNFDDVVNYIKNDVPVVFSITTTKLEDLTNSIMAFPSGHLIVLIGFKQIDGIWHGVFNDPAEYSNEKVLRYYSMDEMLKVWKHYTYIIEEIN